MPPPLYYAVFFVPFLREMSQTLIHEPGLMDGRGRRGPEPHGSIFGTVLYPHCKPPRHILFLLFSFGLLHHTLLLLPSYEIFDLLPPSDPPLAR